MLGSPPLGPFVLSTPIEAVANRVGLDASHHIGVIVATVIQAMHSSVHSSCCWAPSPWVSFDIFTLLLIKKAHEVPSLH